MRRRAAGVLAAALWLAAAPPEARAAEPDWPRAAADTAALLSELIRHDTTNPPGNETPAARHLERFLEARGIPGRVYESAPGRGSLVARLAATEPGGLGEGALLLLSHLDVVAADPDSWTFPPFSGAIRDGHVYGRGALDDKGQAAVFAVALSLLERSGEPRRRDVVLCAAADEEVGGGLGVPWLMEHHWEELGPPAVVWNEGGGSARVPLLGGRVLNGIATTEKRALWLRLVAEGEGGHGSQPVRDSAGDRLVRALRRIVDHETRRRITPTVAETFARVAPNMGLVRGWLMGQLDRPFVLALAGGQLEGSRITNAMIRDTIAVTGLRAGLQQNLIPRRAEALLDVRLLPDTDALDFLAELAGVIDDPSVRIENTMGQLPPVVAASPWENPLFLALEEVLAEEIPEGVTAPLQTTGATDSLYFRQRGVPAYGYFPALLSDELNASIHGLDERVPVAELERAVRVTWQVLRRLTR